MQSRAAMLFLVAVLALVAIPAFAYNAQIHAPAVLLNENSGVLTTISLNVTPGNGTVTITGPATVGQSTISSAKTAVQYVSNYIGINTSIYNFAYRIGDNTSNVSGPSAGLAFSILAYAALKHKEIYNNFTLTGTISPDGAVGEVGGVYDKLAAAERAGMKYAIVPQTFGSADPEYLAYYITQQTFGIPLHMVSNFSQALPYAIAPGNKVPSPFVFNDSSGYAINGLPAASVVCSMCNASYFAQLVNSTMNLTSTWAGYLGSRYSQARSNILQNIGAYREIAAKGYLYAGADLAFVQYPSEFVLANSNNLTVGYARNATSSVEAYCSNITAPQLTNTNYEYVIGGELRQHWSRMEVIQTLSEINASNTTDDIVYALDSLAPAYAWCSSAAQMYSIASQMGGSPVGYSQLAASKAMSAISAARAAPADQLYISSAQAAYNQSQYGTAIYGTVYSETYGSPSTLQYNSSQLISLTKSNATNSTFGIWPSQFANSALFYLYEANASGTENLTYLDSAYTTSILASRLNAANREIAGLLVPANATSLAVSGAIANQTAQLASINGEISGIYSLLFVLILITAVIAVFVLVILLKLNGHGVRQANTKKRA